MPPPLGPLPKPAPEQAGMEDEKQGSEADAEAKDMTFLVNMLRAKELEARLEGALIAAEISSSDVQEASLLQNEAVVAALSAALNIALSAPAVCHASCRTRVAIASALSKLLQYGGSEMCGLIDACACEETAAQHLPERLLEVACLGLQCQQGHSASGSGRAPSWFEGYQQEATGWDGVRELELRRQCACAVASLCNNQELSQKLASVITDPSNANIMRCLAECDKIKDARLRQYSLETRALLAKAGAPILTLPGAYGPVVAC
ncbi:hypothetical protein JKP88DRAFT_230962 [Tribonema minus]|uniref:Uncharacterized protein n=1 Tax=Tribonema minus TaxID=303371 RepID=A0A836CQ87_9STRA|nr:hypothetical protein JKP88DRAFT_230962 [Tribonema minus]